MNVLYAAHWFANHEVGSGLLALYIARTGVPSPEKVRRHWANLPVRISHGAQAFTSFREKLLFLLRLVICGMTMIVTMIGGSNRQYARIKGQSLEQGSCIQSRCEAVAACQFRVGGGGGGWFRIGRLRAKLHWSCFRPRD